MANAHIPNRAADAGRPSVGLLRAGLVLLSLLAAASAARAETAVLTNGQRLAVTGYERDGANLVLHVSGGVVTVPAGEVVRIEPEEYFPPNPPPPAAPSLDASIRDTAARHQLDPDFLASVIKIESRFDPRAVSRKNARGLMQLMPGTSARLGVANVFDPQENLEGGARYLRELLDRYGNRPDLVLAAYNAGEGAVETYGGVPPYRETVAYVQRILGWWQPAELSAAR